jgi:hypothetical protein
LPAASILKVPPVVEGYVFPMTTPQQPIGSGFGAKSSAAEVLDGIDLSGKLAVVTGRLLGDRRRERRGSGGSPPS